MATETVILSSRNLRELQLPNVAIASDYNRGANNQVDCGAGIPQGSKEKKKKGVVSRSQYRGEIAPHTFSRCF